MGRVTDTISGSLATFRTPYKQDIRHLKAYFTPKQEGEGTPSPDNVRPITGWTGDEVYQSSADTSNPTTLPIDWSSAGTVYGGYVDLVTGEAWETWGLKDLGTVNWNKYGNRAGVFYTAAMNEFSAISRLGVLCNKYASAHDNVTEQPDKSIGDAYQLRARSFAIYDTDYADATVAEFKTAMSGVFAAYPLATPTLVTTLTPTALRTLIGTNNIWCNSGDVSVEYDFAESREMQEARKRVMAFDAGKRRVKWDYEYYPNENGMILPEENILVQLGQRVTISWKTTTTEIYTNRYVWRCIGARFDGATSSYAGLTMAAAPKEDTRTYEVTQAGRFIAGNYVIASGNNPENTAFIGEYIKVRIE